MYLEFDCRTNTDTPYVNYAICMTKDNEVIKLDRHSTHYSYKDGKLSMEWTGVYQWDDINGEEIPVNDELDEGLTFIKLDIEDDAPEGYELKTDGAYANGVMIPRKEFNIDEIRNLSEHDALNISESCQTIKGHDVYFVDFGEFFGKSALVFNNRHHIYFADEFQLHHRSVPDEMINEKLTECLNNKLFTEEEIKEPLKTYDEYERKKQFLHNYYGMREDGVSIFHIPGEERVEAKDFINKVKGMTFNPIDFSYMKNKDFVKQHVALKVVLDDAFTKTRDNYEYQKSAFKREMNNHEYVLNLQGDYEVLSVFGKVPYGEDNLEECFEALGFNEIQKKAYRDAKEEYLYSIYMIEEGIDINDDNLIVNEEPIPAEELPAYSKPPTENRDLSQEVSR